MPAFCRPLGVAAHGARNIFPRTVRDVPLSPLLHISITPPVFCQASWQYKSKYTKILQIFQRKRSANPSSIFQNGVRTGRGVLRISTGSLPVKCVLLGEAARVRVKCILSKPCGYAPPDENPRSRERLRGFYDTFLLNAAECDKRFTCRPGRRYRAELCLRGTRGWRRRRWRYASLCRHSPAARPPPRCRRRR